MTLQQQRPVDAPPVVRRPVARSAPSTPPDAGGAWLDAAAIVVGVGAVAAPVGAYFTTSTWLLFGLALLSGIALAATVARVISSRRWVPVVSAVVATIILVTAALTPGEGLGFVLPSVGSIEALQRRIATGARHLANGTAPMPETESTIVALAATVVLIGLVAIVLVCLGRPALVGAVLLVLWVIPGAVNGADADLLAFVIAAACWLVLLTGRRRAAGASGERNGSGRRRPGPSGARLGFATIATGAVVILIAVLVAPFAPRTEPISGPGSVSGFFDATGIDQTVALGEQLRGNSTAVMLRYFAEDPQYLRVLTLTDFTGTRWVADAAERIDLAPPDLVVPGPGQTAIETVVRIDALRTRALPIPIDTAAVAGLPPGWRWNLGFATISSERDDTAELEYTATSLRFSPDRADLAVAAPGGVAGVAAVDLELPEDLPRSITATAIGITADAGDDYERALAIQEWLRVDGGFSYSIDAPVRDGFDGSGVEALEAFLEVREGYCVHFASAMAVMARSLGIPSRMAIGFAPGDATAVEDGLTEWVVTGEDLHAWPELWFDSVGWVPFEPTPGLGLAAVDPIEDAPEADDEAIAPTAAPTTAPEVAPEEDRDDASAAPGIGSGGAGPGVVLAIGLVILLVLAVPGVIRAVRRGIRSRERATAEARWAELVDTADDLGIAVSRQDTPRVTATALDAAITASRADDGPPSPRDAAVAGDRAAIAALRDAVERARYGPSTVPSGAGVERGSAPGSLDPGVALRRAIIALRRSVTPSSRARALIAPRSLRSAARSGIRATLSRYAGAP